jgi:hypothetical protein
MYQPIFETFLYPGARTGNKSKITVSVLTMENMMFPAVPDGSGTGSKLLISTSVFCRPAYYYIFVIKHYIFSGLLQ